MISFETERLIIKEIAGPEELEALLAVYNDPLNMKFIPSGKAGWAREELDERYKKTNDTAYPLGFGVFVVKRKEDGRVIGEGGLFNSFFDLKRLELGYIVDNRYWRMGYGSEICGGLVSYGFEVLGCTELYARMYEANIGSVKICEKLGFRLLRIEETPNGQRFREYRKIKA